MRAAGHDRERKMTSGDSLLVGIGSSYGDDQAGWRVADAVAAHVGAGVTVCRVGTPIDLLDHLAGVERLHICDACHSTGAVGSLHRWRWPDPRIEPVHFSGSHDLGPAAVLKLGERLGLLPSEVIVWGIVVRPAATAENFLQPHLSPEVASGATELAERIVRELNAQSRPSFS